MPDFNAEQPKTEKEENTYRRKKINEKNKGKQ